MDSNCEKGLAGDPFQKKSLLGRRQSQAATKQNPGDDIPEFAFLGIRVHAMMPGDHNRIIRRAIEERRREIIGNHNLHSVYLFRRDTRFQQFFTLAHWVFIDGMPIIWLGRCCGLPLRRTNRMTSIDWLPALLAEAADRGWRVFALGSTPEVGRRAIEVFKQRFPELQMRTHHGFFDMAKGSQESKAVLDAIRAFQPHILLVCMGMPRQEYWIHDNWDRLHANAVLPMGAALDYWAGVIPTPPRWMGRVGLEWLYRLLSEPKRLWRRYLVEPWALLAPLAAELLRISRRLPSSKRPG